VVEQPLVQILVVVAITQVRILRAEVGKGSILTVVGYGLAGPERHVNSVKGGCLRGRPCSKGNHVNIHERVGVFFDVVTLFAPQGTPMGLSSGVLVSIYRGTTPWKGFTPRYGTSRVKCTPISGVFGRFLWPGKTLL